MGLTEITLVLVSLAFVATAAAHDCQNGTRPASEEKREGCDYYCWNAETKSWDKFFFGNGERCFVLKPDCLSFSRTAWVGGYSIKKRGDFRNQLRYCARKQCGVDARGHARKCVRAAPRLFQ
ncbi:uncharacterized protein ISCGN_008601 [Ixodes scapularis]